MREVDQQAFAAAHAQGALVLDVREPDEYAAGHVPGARPVPLGQLVRVHADLPRGEPVYVICAVGARSLSAAGFLIRAGVEAYSVAGGTYAWVHAGRPVVTGPAEPTG